jgi:putative FmdB family regulatory protein
MPLYEYECEACKQRFEVIQKFSDAGPETCARCGKGPVHRQISTPAIQFKGSGWYITDYGGGRSSGASSTGAGDSESKADTKESKTDTKKEGGDAKPAASTSGKSDTSSTTSSTSTSTSTSTSKD